ncbi:MAG: hypothetical protein LBD13_07190 [Spirochaetaceae bacterium]|jgi:hypothetical protein|nr:hypothetical protein [Spirochaetaceae bacterium]
MKKMKQRALFMTGLLAAALVFGSVFVGCNAEEPADEGGGPQITVPKVDDLPALPTGSDAVDSELDATALLGALEAVSSQIHDAIYTVIEAQSGGDYNAAFDFTDEAGTDVTVSGKGTEFTPQPSYEEGDTMKIPYEYAVKGAVTANTAAGGVTVLENSTFGEKTIGSYNLTATQAGTMEATHFSGTVSGKNQYVYALTATGPESKSARIILDAVETISATLTNQTISSAIIPNNVTYTGSLKVYGANNTTPVYTLAITTEAKYWQALGYFGIEYYNGGDGPGPDGPEDITAPDVNDLPALPGESTAVASEAEAEALLGELLDVSIAIDRAIGEAIWDALGRDEETIDQPYDIQDAEGDIVTVTAKTTRPSVPETVNQNDTINISSEDFTQAVVTSDATEEGVTVILGSTFEDKGRMLYNLTATSSGDMETARFDGTMYVRNQSVYALTVTGSGSKGARIILDAAVTISATLTNQTGQSAWNPTYTGSIKVYGAGTTPLYTFTINNEDTYAEARGYFGRGIGGGGGD